MDNSKYKKLEKHDKKVGAISLCVMFAIIIIVAIIFRDSNLEKNATLSCKNVHTEFNRFFKEYKHYKNYGASNLRKEKMIKLYQKAVSKNQSSGCNVDETAFKKMATEIGIR